MLVSLLGDLSAPVKIVLTLQGQVSLPLDTCLSPLPVSPAPSPCLCRLGHRCLAAVSDVCPQCWALCLMQRRRSENFLWIGWNVNCHSNPCKALLDFSQPWVSIPGDRDLLTTPYRGGQRWPKEMFVSTLNVIIRKWSKDARPWVSGRFFQSLQQAALCILLWSPWTHTTDPDSDREKHIDSLEEREAVKE